VHVGQLAEELRERGHEVLVVAPALRPSRATGATIVGRAFNVPYQGTVAPICPSPLSIPRVTGALRSFRPDVVHAHEPLVPSSAMFATVRSPAPVVATFHAHAERSLLLDVAAPFLRPVWRRLAVRVAVSEAAARFVTARMGRGNGVRVVPNGVDVDLFAKAEPRSDLPPGRRILWVGRLDRQKGFPVAVRAFAELAGELPDVWFVVVGEGRDRMAVANVPEEIRRRILMLGSVPHRALPAHHAGADVFVSAAVGQESFGLVLVEAMAAGVPVVATDIPGYREVARDGVDALLVEPRDSGALAGAIRRVLAEPATAAGLAGSGRARAETFRWSAVVSGLEDAYREAIATRGTAANP
jgi:phosphatidylinositol alpha-mannosyltransferase